MRIVAAMHDWNVMTVVIVVSLFALYKLELLATVLSLRAFPAAVPAAMSGWLTQEKLDLARAYQRVNARFHLTQEAFGLTVVLVFWALGGFPWLDGLSRALAPGEITAGLVFVAALVLGQTLLGLPFAYYDTFVIEQKFGFNRATKGTFVLDRVKGLALGAVLGLPLLAAVLWIFLHVAHAWLWAWAVVVAFQWLLVYLAPTLIMPLFNKFTPMPDGPLKQAIEELGERCRFPLTGVFVMDGSKRSTKANAFFTGLGKRKKIALYDTLIEKSQPDELLGVLAHEIGHFRRGHIKQRLAVGMLQTAAVCYLLGLAVDPGGGFARLLFDAFGVERISPHAGLVFFSLLMQPAGKLLGVLSNAWSRKHEFEADAYAAEAIGGGAPLGRALMGLATDHLSHPSPAPLRVWLDYSHPPLLQRLEALAAHDAPSRS